MKVITIEKVPAKLLEAYRGTAEPLGVSAEGVTLVPKKTGGYQTLEVLIREKMSQRKTRRALAHELFHCLQYLTGCELDEDKNYQVSKTMVAALVEKRKKRAE